ncbi:MAG: transcription-repair coupling factor [Flavobacteriales bacterium]|nr:transcription-repair coupling factor [Flavobacteriales bacterium]
MQLKDLRELFERDGRVAQICVSAGATEVQGLVGSAAAIVAAAVTAKSEGDFLFVLEDKERAAYFLNDLETALEGCNRQVLFFPRSARVPYQSEKTENANVAMRAEALSKLMAHRGKVCIVSFPEALAEQVVTRQKLKKHTYTVNRGDVLEQDFLDEILIDYGFEKVDYVYTPGQYSIRGGIVDIFSYAFDHPYRIEMFGDQVEEIRKFDPSDQLSTGVMARAVIIPDVGDTMVVEGHQPLLEFLGPDAKVWVEDAEDVAAKLDAEVDKARLFYERLDQGTNRMPPEELYTTAERYWAQLQKQRVVEFGGGRGLVENEAYAEVCTVKFHMTPQPVFNKNFDLLAEQMKLNAQDGVTTYVLSGQGTQLERLHDIFEDRGDQVKYEAVPTEISEGFVDKGQKLACYTDHQIFERYHRFRLKDGFKKNKQALTIKELLSLEPGDFVVHIDHGIGEFSGLQKIEQGGVQQEAIRLKYKGGDILYVSVHSLHRISKYSGKEGKAPSINKLGSPAWQKTKNKTKKRVKEIAYDLLKLYAKRRASKGFAFTPDTYLQTELEASFMYQDTPDQLASTIAVKEDMEKEMPMDRLVCGDVGFGKTEIAVRAAFKAATDGKQVAVMVPTTILSTQHLRSFRRRLKEFPVTVDYINRNKKGTKLTETLKRLATGEIDILIGTHAIVGKRVKWKDLGLLVIDEEQKFGVGVKDKLKTLRASIDSLTLTATPIPRTLQFSLMGARDLSIIATPPANRHPVETVLTSFNEEVIRDAVSYEVSRGGQVFFVHNRVANIREVAGMISRVVPDVRVAIGHGQMDGVQLERVMSEFIDGAYDVMVATTIIENGIDISNANTILINEAHHFGLSDLHQLRGRVGRSNKKAFCYLLSPPLHVLPTESRKRMQAMEQFSDLGSGMNIAMRDLDIRGAGDLLGGEQSGFISDIGFEMYQKILAEAVRELKETEFADLAHEEAEFREHYVEETALETDLAVLLPDHYISDISERIALYRELDDLADEKALQGYEARLIDRFGALPVEAEDLLQTIRLRWMAQIIGFSKLVLKGGRLIGVFAEEEDSEYYKGVRFKRVLDYMQRQGHGVQMYQRNGSLRLRVEPVDGLVGAMKILRPLSGTQEPASATSKA